MTDRRNEGLQFPIASTAFAQLVFPDGASGATLTQTATLSNINGVIEQIEIVISTFENGSVTSTVTVASEQDATLFTEATLADATTHLKQTLSEKGTPDADFNSALVNGTLTLTGVVSADPGTNATIDVTVFYR
jgi:hypothetical protein